MHGWKEFSARTLKPLTGWMHVSSSACVENPSERANEEVVRLPCWAAMRRGRIVSQAFLQA